MLACAAVAIWISYANLKQEAERAAKHLPELYESNHELYVSDPSQIAAIMRPAYLPHVYQWHIHLPVPESSEFEYRLRLRKTKVDGSKELLVDHPVPPGKRSIELKLRTRIFDEVEELKVLVDDELVEDLDKHWLEETLEFSRFQLFAWWDPPKITTYSPDEKLTFINERTIQETRRIKAGEKVKFFAGLRPTAIEFWIEKISKD